MPKLYGRKYSLTEQRLKELLHYDPDTGIFTRKRTVSSNGRIGQQCGWLNDEGYIGISVDRVHCKAHRLAWFYMTGKWPTKIIDHINRIKTDNRFCNLRDVGVSENQFNRPNRRHGPAFVNNPTGYRGVYYVKGQNKFRARIRVVKKIVTIGQYTTALEAHEHYLKAAREIFGEFG